MKMAENAFHIPRTKKNQPDQFSVYEGIAVRLLETSQTTADKERAVLLKIGADAIRGLLRMSRGPGREEVRQKAHMAFSYDERKKQYWLYIHDR